MPIRPRVCTGFVKTRSTVVGCEEYNVFLDTELDRHSAIAKGHLASDVSFLQASHHAKDPSILIRHAL
jgi:hypothetical protein